MGPSSFLVLRLQSSLNLLKFIQYKAGMYLQHLNLTTQLKLLVYSSLNASLLCASCWLINPRLSWKAVSSDHILLCKDRLKSNSGGMRIYSSRLFVSPVSLVSLWASTSHSVWIFLSSFIYALGLVVSYLRHYNVNIYKVILEILFRGHQMVIHKWAINALALGLQCFVPGF